MNFSNVDISALLEATWPSMRQETCGPFQLNFSDGGGKRVTAAVLQQSAFAAAELDQADRAMRAAGQTPLYRVHDGQDDLDENLAARGFEKIDETLLRTTPLAPLLEIETPRLSAFNVWPPLAIMSDIWAEAGIGADRLAVMARCSGPHTCLLARAQDHPAGVGFVAIHGDTAMVHALETRVRFQRQGVAQRLMGHAAQWAARHGANRMSVLVTAANVSARAFYAALGMAETQGYHYRIDREGNPNV